MVETVGTVASIIQLVDTALKAKDYIQDFIHAPQKQLKLVSKIADLRPLVQELQDRVVANASSGILQRMKNPLEDFKATMERFTDKLDPGDGPLSKFSKRLTWTMWSKKETLEYLNKFEQFKSLLNSWLLVDLWDASQHHQHDNDKHFKNLAEQRDRHHKVVIGSLNKVNAGISGQQEIINTLGLAVNNLANKVDVINAGVLHIIDDQKCERDDMNACTERERMQIINWLSPINFLLRHADISRVRQNDTGGWLLADPRFKRWECGSERTLWCHGIPGAGKTVLASTVVDHLTTSLENKNIGVACLYLNHKEADTQTPVNLLSGLWRQLVLGRDVGPLAKQLYQQHHEKRTTLSMMEVVDLLHSCFTEFSKVYITVDALDEYSEDRRWILLQHLAAMGPNVNVMITSRPNITPVSSHPNHDTIEIRANNDDIQKYVNTQIQRSPRLLTHLRTHPELREEIHRKIAKTADGMFLLAKLHLESLTAKPTIKAVRNALKHLPKGLTDTYNIVMQRIDSQSEEDRKTAHSAIIWVANAKRPLTVAEIQTALAIEPDSRQLDEDNLMDINLILAACAGLIVVDERSSFVRLVHYTTQEYLDSIQFERFPDAQTEITRTLLTFLAFDGFPDSCWDLWDLPPLLDYSQYCLVHAVGRPEGPLRNMIVQFLRRAVLWQLILSRKHPRPWNTGLWNIVWPSQPSVLWIAAAANLIETTKFLLEEAPINKHSEHPGISIASYYGHFEMVQLLLENGANVNTSAKGRGPPMTVASEAGHDSIVRFLLKNGADANARGGRYGFALHAALAKNQEEIAQLLIENGADVNLQVSHSVKDEYLIISWQCEHGGALTTASWYGTEYIVRLLLQRGVEVNAHGGQCKFALLAALTNGHGKIAQLLIENGADVNVLNENLCSPLELAADLDDQNLVQLLVSSGADPNAYGGMALLRASRDGHENIVRCLLENGADVNLQNEQYGSTLRAACDGGHRTIVELLVKHGAKIDYRARRDKADQF